MAMNENNFIKVSNMETELLFCQKQFAGSISNLSEDL